MTPDESSIEVVRANLHARQRKLDAALGRLKDQAKARFDLGNAVAENPVLTLGGAFVVGAWLARRIG